MKQSVNTETQYFIKAIRQFVEEAKASELVKTLAIVKNIDKEGFLLDVELVDRSQFQEVIEGVPLLRNAYFNIPVYEGDLVMLQTMDRSFDNYVLRKDFNDSLKMQTYFALPYTVYEKFKHKNEFSIITKEENFKLSLNDKDGVKIENKRDCKEKHKSFEVKSDTTVLVEGQTSVELKTAAMSLGSAFEQLIDALANVPALNTASGGPVAEWPAIVAQLAALKPLIKQNFK